MIKIIENIKKVTENRTTYKIGLLQAKAYRILKNTTTLALSQFKISTIDWALLGFLFENKRGIKLSDISKELGVEAPFVTIMANNLIKKGLVYYEKIEHDKRAKLLTLTLQGEQFIVKNEKILRNDTRHLVAGATLEELAGYLSVLEKIISNSKL